METLRLPRLHGLASHQVLTPSLDPQESVSVPEPQVIISPIVSAILGGNSECVRLLVEAGASVNSPAGITDNM